MVVSIFTGCQNKSINQVAEEVAEATTSGSQQIRAFSIGMEHHAMPETEQDYIQQLSTHIANHNRVAPYLWRNNPMADLHIFVGNYNNRNQFWFIHPNGNVTEMTFEEASYARPYKDFSYDSSFWDFSYGDFFEDGLAGMYTVLNLSEEQPHLNHFQRSMEIGTGPIHSTSVQLHVGFHMLLQHNLFFQRPLSTDIRSENFLDTEARALRRLINIQLLDAIANPDDISDILEALSSFIYYRSNFEDDYIITRSSDNTEGTTHWYDKVASLFSVYSDQIQTDQDLHDAFRYLATYHRDGTWLTGRFGAITESYVIGSLALVLADRYIERFEWQELFETREIHPLLILLEHFENYDIPPFDRAFTEGELQYVYVQRGINFIVWSDFFTLMNQTLDVDLSPEDFSDLVDVMDGSVALNIENQDDDELMAQMAVAFISMNITPEQAEEILSRVLSTEISLDFLDDEQYVYFGFITYDGAFAIMEFLERL